MQDRVSQYPGRVKLTPVSGQENVYDMEWADGATVAGTALNKANLLADTTASLFGLTSAATPNQVLAKIPPGINTGWKLLQSYTTAGSFSWTAPALFGSGVKYKIGVLVIGGGGSGGAVSVARTRADYLNRFNSVASGGASGQTAALITEVTPNSNHAIVVGKGGEAGVVKSSSSSSPYAQGSNGGTSSFDSVTALGGEGGNSTGGEGTSNTVVAGGFGAQCSSYSYTNYNPSQLNKNPFGGTIMSVNYHTSDDSHFFGGIPSMCINPFENKLILGAGGWARTEGIEATHGEGGKSPYQSTGTAGGDGNAEVTSSSISAQDGGQPGCGGGAVAAFGSTVSTSRPAVTSGAGADGAVYIYVQGDF